MTHFYSFYCQRFRRFGAVTALAGRSNPGNPSTQHSSMAKAILLVLAAARALQKPQTPPPRPHTPRPRLHTPPRSTTLKAVEDQQHYNGTSGFRIERMLTRLVAERFNDHRGIDWSELVTQHKEFLGHTSSSISMIYRKIFLLAQRAKTGKSDVSFLESEFRINRQQKVH